MCRRFHFSSDKLVLDTKVTEHINGSFGNTKPNGLWYSIGYSWKTWCYMEAFHLEGFQYRTQLYINPNKVLHLNAVKDIDRFTKKYGVDSYVSKDGTLTDTVRIDWTKVAEKWCGIEISPYQWSRRLTGGAGWYYGWDIASGCIWDTSILKAAPSMLQCTVTAEYAKDW